ncbi:MAG TPA: glutathione S-transferase family protein [Caulobacteraceae bacterium]
MLKIWGRATAPNVQKVLWGCEELGLAYQRVDLGGPFGGGDEPAYRQKNPNGLVPTLADEDFVLWESHAILRYLAAKAGDDALFPMDLRQRGLVDQWLDWQAVHQAHAVRGLVALLLKPGVGQLLPEQLDTARKAAEVLFGILDRRLAQSLHVAGESFTLADIPNAIGARRWMTLPIDRPDLPAMEAWLDRVMVRPAFKRMGAALAETKTAT